jgi:fibronectin-binding autotransporter adhesin
MSMSALARTNIEKSCHIAVDREESMSEKMNCQVSRCNWGMRGRLIWLAAAASVSLGGINSAFAVAPTPAFTWDATGTSDYNTPTNWNPDLVNPPANSDNQFLTINNGATAAINGNAEGLFLILGLTGSQSGNLVINSGTATFGELRVGGRDSIPDDYNSATPVFSPNNGGSGTVVQNPGTTVNVTYNAGSEPPAVSFYVGDSAGLAGNTSTGSYTITGTAALPSTLLSGILGDDAIVIGTGTGTAATFNQGTVAQPDFTTVTSAGFISVGRRGANGTYTMRGGSLSANGTTNPGIVVGDGDSGIIGPPVGTGIASTVGTFNQIAGTVNDNQDLRIGRRNATGTYNMSSGTLNIGGSLVLGGAENDGYNMNGNATFNLTSGDVTLSTGNVNIGNTSSTVTPTVGTTGLMTMTGGTLTMNGSSAILAVGNGIKATGTLNLSGGTISVNASNTALLDIGRNQGAGLVKVSGTGTLNVGQLTLNSSSPASPVTRELRIEGGTVNVKFWEQGAVTPTNVTRVINMSGGNLNITDPAAVHRGGRLVTYNFSGGTASFVGTMPMDTSTINVSNTANVTFATYRTQSASTNVTGGTFNATAINDSGNEGGITTISGGAVNVTGTWNITNASPGTAGALNITGGTTTVGTLVTGGTTAGSLLSISGGTNSFTTLTLSSNTKLKTDNAISLGSNVNVGNAEVNVNSGSLALTGSMTNSSRTLTKTGVGSLTISGAQTNSGTATITNSAGTLNLNSNGGANLTVNANGGTTNFGVAQTLKAIGVGVSGGTLNLGANNASVGALSLAGSPQNYGLTYGSLASSAAIKSNVYFSGTGIVTVGTAGDYNHSGEVEAGDYLIWRKNSAAYGNSAGYDLWRQNYGNIAVPGAGSGLVSGNQTVPEPGTLLLAMVGVLLACAGRRRR